MADTECPKESLHNTIVFAPHDWGGGKREAWIYGIVVGWDRGSLKELQKRFRWSDSEIERLQRLHLAFKKLN